MTSGHTVKAYDEELRGLEDRILRMGQTTIEMHGAAIAALLRHDLDVANSVIERDSELDRAQHEVEDQAVAILARRQPVAGDLREVIAALKTATDLERAGDHAKNTAKRTLAVDPAVDVSRFAVGVRNMDGLVRQQLSDVMRAFAERDDALALAVWQRDDEVDEVFTAMFRELLTYMFEDPRAISTCTHLLFCAKNIERMGDIATNIAETVHFVITGETLSEDRPKADATSTMSQP